MKTAVSIPDDLFSDAEKTATKLHISRSELYQKAIEKYIDDFNDQLLLDNLNSAYGVESSDLDPALREMQAQTILKKGSKEDNEETW